MQLEFLDLVFTIRVFLGLIFITSGGGKLLNRKKFTQAVQRYDILSPFLSRVYAGLLPWAEIIVGIGLLLGIAPILVAVLGSVLLISFIIAIVVNLRRGRTLECHCYGILSTNAIGWGTVARNLLLLTLTLSLAVGSLSHVVSVSWIDIWGRDFLFLTAADNWIPVVLLVCFGLVVLRLLDQGIDFQVRVYQVRLDRQSYVELTKD